jgi:putative ABC transport system permease protein
MGFITEFVARIRGTLTKRVTENRLAEEIDFHLDMHAQREIRAGVEPERARRDAVVAFGGRESWREAARDEYRHRNLESLWQDARYAIRTLRKSPAFTAVALLTFALGIGANTAVFSVVSGILLRPLPFANPDRLASIWPTKTISNAELVYLQQHAKTLESVSAFSPGWGIALTGSGEPRQLDAARVSANFFRTLGVRPALGRDFTEAESSPGQWDVAILNHALWVENFGADASVIGRIVQMDGTPTRIIGVMPAGFEVFQHGVEAWLPLQIDPTSRFYTGQTALAFGRLAAGHSFASATSEIATLAPRMRTEFNYTEEYGRGGTVTSLREALVGNVRQSLLVLLGAVAFVLLIAGANLGNLMLVAAIGRRRELAVRRALGASRQQVARQLLVHSIIVAIAGGLLGTAVGIAGVRGLKSILPPSLPMLSGVTVDWRVLLVSAVVTLGIGIAFGIAPALLATRVDPESALRVSGSGSINRAGVATRQTLVVVEIALAMVLVVGAGLMTESLWRLSRVQLGFDPHGLLSFRVQPSGGRVRSAEQSPAYFAEMMDRIRALPGVVSVGSSQHLPLSGFNWGANLDIEKSPIASTAEHPRVTWRSIGGDYFGTMRIPLVRGRAFTAADTRDAVPVVVINAAMAQHFWPNRDPLGERIRLGNGSKNDWATIVGIVGSVRFMSPSTPPGDEVYRPNTQQGFGFMHIVVRTNGSPLALMPSVRTAIRAMDTTVPIAEVRSMSELFDASTATPRTIAFLLLAFAGVGLALGAVGIYGVISYAVTQRTRELGIRVALGAVEGRIVSMVLNDGIRMAAIGIVLGAVAATVAARSLRTLVFGVATTDWLTYIGVAAVLTVVALAASYIPARRASRVDPLIALRSD